MQDDEIVARLRGNYQFHIIDELHRRAADRIEQLRAENATLRRMLDQFVGDFKDEVQREAL